MRVASILCTDIPNIKQQIARAIPVCDIIELRLDYLTEISISAIAELRQAITLPVIFTLRKKSQGGYCELPEQQRLFTLQQLAMLLPEYIDLEFDVPTEFADILRNDYPGIQLICSYHDFNHTPDDLSEIFEKIYHPSYALFKIATFANNICDTLRLLIFVQNISHKHRVIGIAMGEFGQASRILAPVVGSEFTYGSIDDSISSAPGQLTLAELTHVYRLPALNRNTAIYALLGCPVSQSSGHLFHNHMFAQLAKNAVYVKLYIPPEYLARAVSLLKQLPFAGFSVTIPHKETMVKFVDVLSDDAQKIGALNTIRSKNEQYYAFNTDGIAAADVLANHLDLLNKSILILGAGGSAKAIAYSLIQRGAVVTLCNRTLERAQLFQQMHGDGNSIDFTALFSLQQLPYDVIINTLPADAYVEQCINWQIPQSTNRQTIAMDIVLKPLLTPFLHVAKAAGYQCISGDALFLNQALRQLQIWFDLSEQQRCDIQSTAKRSTVIIQSIE